MAKPKVADLMQPNKPYEIEGQNFRRGFRNAKVGEIRTIQFEVTKEVWDACETVPRGAIVKGVLWWEYPDQPSQPASDVSDEGAFWNLMFKKGFQNNLQLCDVLGVETPGEVHDALHGLFNVESLNEVTPEIFAEWCKERGLLGLVTMINQVSLAKAS